MNNVAVRGCLIVCILICTSALAQQQNGVGSDAAASNTGDHQSPERTGAKSATTHFAPGNRVDPNTYRAICDSPKDKDHADLCQQWRVAEAAESQIWLTGVGLVLVFGTLVFTAIAARAARDAVKEGEKATAAALQAVGMERAWITFGGFSCGAIPVEKTMEPSKGIQGFGYIVTWKNTGRTPALRLTCYTDYRIVFPPEMIPTFEADEPPTDGLKSVPLGPGDTVHTKLKHLRLEDAGMHVHLVVYSRVEYYDLISSIMRISEICARVESTPQMRPDGTIGGVFTLSPVGRQNTAS